ncbi:MAG: GTP-binding protein [Promethearchaeota archaeon]
MKITLSLWDVAGQERFDFFKTDFYKGVAAIGLVFDLSRPDTFDDIDLYFNDIRKRSGNIPIVLVGNKSDLKKDLGETIHRERIIKKVNQHHLFEFIETSALENENVDKLFNRLAIIALLDLQPRLGEIVNSNHFRFKVLLVGNAAVGKSSLIKTFTGKKFEKSYKLTVGLDFMTKDFEIFDEDLPKEVHDNIKKSVKLSKRRFKRFQKREEVLEIRPSIVNIRTKDTLIESSPVQGQFRHNNKIKIRKPITKILLSLIIIVIILVIISFFFFFQ